MTFLIRYSIFLFFIILTGLWSQSCSREDVSLGPAKIPDDYAAEFERWHQERLYDLTHPTGWMRLAGLYWLEEGTQTFGSGPEVAFQFPDMDSGPFGEFTMKDDSVFLSIYSESDLFVDSTRITPETNVLIYTPSLDAYGESTPEYAPIVKYKELEWFIIKRDDLMGIRLYNKRNQYVDQFQGFERYPIDSSLVVKARLLPYEESRTLRVANILGQVSEEESPGVLEFRIGSQVHTLTPTIEGEKYFIAFSDPTNKQETFESGRYLYVDPPEPGKTMTIIDFNKAYNPPCSYSSFSTCQLPPPENWLKVSIEAGELRPTVKF